MIFILTEKTCLLYTSPFQKKKPRLASGGAAMHDFVARLKAAPVVRAHIGEGIRRIILHHIAAGDRPSLAVEPHCWIATIARLIEGDKF